MNLFYITISIIYFCLDTTSSSNQQEYVPEQQSSGEEEISGNRVRKRIKTGDVTNPENLPENCLHVRHSRNKVLVIVLMGGWDHFLGILSDDNTHFYSLLTAL